MKGGQGEGSVTLGITLSTILIHLFYLSGDNSAQTRPFLWQNPQVAERHTLAEPAFSMAEPAGGV